MSGYEPRSDENRRVAERSAMAIRDYWLARGVKVKTWIEPSRAPGRKRELLYVVKSEGIPK